MIFVATFDILCYKFDPGNRIKINLFAAGKVYLITALITKTEVSMSVSRPPKNFYAFT